LELLSTATNSRRFVELKRKFARAAVRRSKEEMLKINDFFLLWPFVYEKLALNGQDALETAVAKCTAVVPRTKGSFQRQLSSQ